MSSSEAALTALVELLAAAATPEPVVIDDGRIVHTDFSGTLVRPLGLERVGRSRRGGAILDLQLILEVTTHGPHALATMERHLVTIELSQLAAQEQSSPPQRPPGQNSVGMLSLVVVVPVSLSLAEPQPPIVTQPPVIEVHLVSRLDGVLVDTDGHTIAGAIVRMAETGVTSVTDTAGRFRLLNTTDASGPASIDVTVRGHRHATEAQRPVVEDSTAPGLAVVVVDVHADSHPPRSDIGAEV